EMTGRVLFVNEDTEVTNFGEHLLRRTVDELFYDLAVRPRVLQGKHVPGIGLNHVYEQNTVPQLREITAAIRELLDEAAWSRMRSEDHIECALPELCEGVSEAEVVRWLVKPGDGVKRGQALLEVMTDKATMEVPSPFIGTIQALNAEPGRQVKIGATILSYDGAPVAAAEPARRDEPAGAKRAPAANCPATAVAAPVLVKASPSVRHMARKLGVDIARVRGSGPGGRVLIDDLATSIQAARPAESAKPQAAVVDVGVAGT